MADAQQKDKIIYTRVFSKHRSTGTNPFARFFFSTLVLSVLGSLVCSLYDVVVTYEVIAASSLISALHQWSKVRKWTFRVIQVIDENGERQNVFEVIRHRHPLHPVYWVREINTGYIRQSSLRLYKSDGKYSLMHRTGLNSYAILTVRRKHKEAFKAYCHKFIAEFKRAELDDKLIAQGAKANPMCNAPIAA